MCILCDKSKITPILEEVVLPILRAASQGSSTGTAKDVKPQLILGRLRGSVYSLPDIFRPRNRTQLYKKSVMRKMFLKKRMIRLH